MSPSFAVFTFVNAWWVMLFFVIPFAVRTANTRSAVEYAAAPQAVHWKKIFLITALLSLVVTAVLALIIASGLVPVRGVV